MKYLKVLLLFAAPVPFLIPLAVAYCECGYTTQITVGSVTTIYLFTDLIESDFLHIPDVKKDTDWSIQSYNVTASAARGPFGYVPSFRRVHPK